MKSNYNLSGLVISATPDGKTRLGERDKLMRQLKSGNISKVNKERLASFLAVEKKKRNINFVTIQYFGRTVTMKFTDAEYERYKQMRKQCKGIL